MAYNSNGSTTNSLVYGAQILDVSTASVATVGVLAPGRLIKAACTLSAAITNTTAVITVKKYPAGVSADAVTCGTISIAASGSAAGKVYAMTITGTEAACTFADGDVLAFDGGGESDTTSIGRCTALIRG
jgi:hypothetical protein